MLFRSKVNKIGARKQGQMSRSMSKPTNVIGVFLYGGSYEFHASMTDGRYSGWIWLYKDGVLAHEGKNHDVNTFVADIHQKIKAQ